MWFTVGFQKHGCIILNLIVNFWTRVIRLIFNCGYDNYVFSRMSLLL